MRAGSLPRRTPAVSVIVPTLNRLSYLQTALESVESQEFRDFEVIVLDDGSTDGTLEYLDSYQCSLPFRWFGFQGKERSFLRNYGVRQTRGELIAFLDDDDEWLPEKLEKQVAFLKHYPEVGLLATRTTVMDANGLALPGMTRQHRVLYADQAGRGLSFSELAYRCVMFTSSVVVKRDVFSRAGEFDEHFAACEDLDFYLRVSLMSNLHVLEDELVRYRAHHGGSSSKLNLAQIQVNAKHLEMIRNDSSRDSTGQERRTLLMATARCHYVGGRYRDALATLKAIPAGSAAFWLEWRNFVAVLRILAKLAHLGALKRIP